jgi:hypothetical protein
MTYSKDYQPSKWVFRKVGLDVPEYRTYMDWYWRSNKDFSNVGITCPKCKGFVTDKEVSEALNGNGEDYVSKVTHSCNANLVFVKSGVEL